MRIPKADSLIDANILEEQSQEGEERRFRGESGVSATVPVDVGSLFP